MKLPPLTEKEFQDQVVELAQTLGWLVYHTYDSRKSVPGFPDLVMVRNGSLLFAELKSEKGKVTPEQREWLFELGGVSVIPDNRSSAAWTYEVRLWRPSDWDEIVEVLR